MIKRLSTKSDVLCNEIDDFIKQKVNLMHLEHLCSSEILTKKYKQATLSKEILRLHDNNIWEWSN